MAAKKPLKVNAATGQPAGRLLELSLETNLPTPYVVSEQISIAPPTKAAAAAMNRAHQSVIVYGAILSGMLRRTDDPPSSDDLAQVSELIEAAEDDYNRQFFGTAHDAVMEFFDQQPQQLWEAFTKDIRTHFLPTEPADDSDERIAELTAALAELDPNHPVLSGKAHAPST